MDLTELIIELKHKRAFTLLGTEIFGNVLRGLLKNQPVNIASNMTILRNYWNPEGEMSRNDFHYTLGQIKQCLESVQRKGGNKNYY